MLLAAAVVLPALTAPSISYLVLRVQVECMHLLHLQNNMAGEAVTEPKVGDRFVVLLMGHLG